MKVRLLLIALLAQSLFICADLYGQDEDEYSDPLNPGVKETLIFFGPSFGYNQASHSVELPTVYNDHLCPQFDGGTGSGMWVGMTFEYHIGKFEKSNMSIIFRALYNTMPADFTEGANDYEMLIESEDGTSLIPENTVVDFYSESTYNMLSFDVCYKWLPYREVPFGLTLGLTMDYGISTDLYQTMRIRAPLNSQFDKDALQPYVDNNQIKRFDDNYQTAVFHDEEPENATSIRLALKLGVQYEFNLQILFPNITGVYVVPEAFYNYGLTNLTSDRDWKVNAFQIGFDIRYALQI